MSHHRSYSFDTDDGNTSPVRQRYQDSPDRPRIHPPPPQYFSPPPPDEQVSPVSAAYRPASVHSRHSSRHGPSFDIPRRSVVITNNDGVPPPLPPPHRTSPTREAYRPESNVTVGLDNFGSQSRGGGLDRTAREVADRNQRQSGVEAARGLPTPVDQANYYSGDHAFPAQSQRHNIPRRPLSRPYADGGSSGSVLPLAAGAMTPGVATPHEFPYDGASSQQSMRSLPQSYHAMGQPEPYDDSPYQRPRPYSHHAIDDNDILPRNIVDDGDDGFMPEPKRRSILPLSRDRSREALGEDGSGKVAGAAAGAAAGGALGGLFGRNQKNVSSSGSYNAVSSSEGVSAEKSEWLSRQTKGNNRMRWIVGITIGAVLIIAIVAGVVGGVLGSKHSSSGKDTGANTNNAASDTATNGDLDINSAEIQALMNNKNLHKVFPGMDYTPWGVQYPLCLTYPPSQNNVTRDMAVLSQLTNSVRLYGTDCNQTEMVLHAIEKLQLKDMKVWLGVWIDPNMTTTDRQLDQMYKILAEVQDRSIFKGVIIGNEALFRAGQDKSESQAELVTYLNSARSNFTSLGYNLSVSTSDLGDNWDASLAQASDFVMSNIHPFFAGVNVDDAAAWSWNFWQTHDVVLTGKETNQVIAETGWPSGGGTDCGNTANVCAPGDTGSVASVDNMNKFMDDWVCQALANGTNYFWFEAFDEAWKVAYNEPGKEWEDKWGLMDTARNLKPGLQIPDCGGKTVS